MLKSLRKRPMLRPLFIWIPAIVLEVRFQISDYISYFLCIPLLWLVISFCYSYRSKKQQLLHMHWGMRWTWGALFLSLLFVFAVQRTAFAVQTELRDFSKFDAVSVFFTRQQDQLLQKIDRLPLADEEKSVASTLLIGYKQGLNPQMRKQFSTAGVAHLLAVSGFHVAVVCGCIGGLRGAVTFRRIRKSLKIILTLSFLWLFVGVTGFSTSALRAGWMLTFYLVAQLTDRKTDSYNILAASALFLLFYQPLYLFEIGFQLSYLAVFFILCFQPLWNRLFKVRNPILSFLTGCVCVSVAAQIGTAALVSYYFGYFSVVSLFANLPLTLLSMLLIPVGLFTLLWPAEWIGFEFLQDLTCFLMHTLCDLTLRFSQLSIASFHYRMAPAGVVLFYGCLFLLIYRIRQYRRLGFFINR